MLTPLVIVIAAIGIANVVFALDSIPAIFGLTSDAYIIFTANALALMGLRQLYFLIGGLAREGRLPEQGAGRHPRLHRREAHHRGGARLAPRRRSARSTCRDIGIVTSLLFIVATLTLTTVLSLVKTNRDARRAAEAE